MGLGDKEDNVINSGTINGSIKMNAGNDTLTFNAGSVLSGITQFNGGDDTDTLTFATGATETLDGSIITNWEIINLDNSTITITKLVIPTLNVCGGSTTLGNASSVDDVLGCVSDDEIEITDTTVIAIEGAGGADTITVSDGASVTDGVYGGGDGQDTSSTSDGNDTISIDTTGTVGLVDAGIGDDIVDLKAGTITNNVLGQAGADTITLSGATVSGDTGGGAGADTINLNSGTTDSASGGADNDQITLAGATVTNAIDAGAGDDTVDLTSGNAGSVDGNDGADTITLNGATVSGDTGGGAGADIINLTSGTTDSASGGADNDTIKLQGATVTAAIDAGTGDDTVTWSSGTLGSFTGGDGSDTLELTATEYDGSQVLDGGDDVSSADGYVDRLTLQGLDLTMPGVNLANWENVVIGSGSTVSFSDNALTAGSLSVNSGGTLEATTGTLAITGNLINSGTVNMQDDTTDDSITVSGDYTGGGVLNIDTVLGDGLSATDTLVVAGNTTGATTINITNAGGTGAYTTGTDGILIVDVGGTSAGTFTAAGDTAVGDYTYDLVQVGQDWYLQSIEVEDLKAQINGYQVLSSIFSHNIDSLRQRIGYRDNIFATMSYEPGTNTEMFAGNVIHKYKNKNGKVATSSSREKYSGMEAWARLVGGNREMNPDDDYASFDEDRYFLQVGVGGIAAASEHSRWLLGINALAGNSDVSVDDITDNNVSNIDSDFYGLGLTATLYQINGFYTDFVAQYTKYSAEIDSLDAADLVDIDGENLAFSVELGKRYYPWTDNKTLSLTPQAQVIWSDADFDDFTDSDGLAVSMGDGETVTGRVGLVLESRNSKVDKFAGFVGTNLYFNLAGDTKINVSGEAYDYARHDGWFELSAGGTYKLSKGLGLYGQVDLGTSIDSFGDSNSAKGELGVRGWW